MCSASLLPIQQVAAADASNTTMETATQVTAGQTVTVEGESETRWYWYYINTTKTGKVIQVQTNERDLPVLFNADGEGVVTISNRNLLNPLRSITEVEWIVGKRYKVRGFWVADAKTMCFDLSEGVQEDFRSVVQDDGAE